MKMKIKILDEYKLSQRKYLKFKIINLIWKAIYSFEINLIFPSIFFSDKVGNYVYNFNIFIPKTTKKNYIKSYT